MKKKILALALGVMLALTAACGGPQQPGSTSKPVSRVDDVRALDGQHYTVANIASTDKVGRTVRTGDVEDNGKSVGLFYHIWHGNDGTRNYGAVYDITKLLATDPDSLYDIEGTEASPMGRFHYWGEPLYGYYCSEDPYIIRKHCELLTMAGVDYLVYDTTNANPYTSTAGAIFEIYQEYYNLGWDVPKIAFYCNSSTAATVRSIYNSWYEKGLYEDLWYKPDGVHPLIIGAINEITNQSELEKYLALFDFRYSQWPNDYSDDLEHGFPWMSWKYPQANFNGTMSVSLAQHPGARMSEGRKSNNGRGFDYSVWRNNSDNTELGTNYAGQWETVFENNADRTKQPVNNVFITGFNEWKAIKMSDGNEVFFVDTFNEEYSRDIEMMKGGYDDNYYLQTIDTIRRYKYSEAKHYKYYPRTIDIDDATLESWFGTTEYLDFTGDAAVRDYSDAFGSQTYTDNSGRNDISAVYVAHDADYLYVRADAAADITPYNGTDLNWMTLFIKTDEDLANSFAGYKYVVNRKPDGTTTSVERSTGGYAWQTAGTADYRVYGNTIIYRVPLAALGLTADTCTVQIKVSDNVTNYGDIMDYYVTGDSAPIGRLSYSYGY